MSPHLCGQLIHDKQARTPRGGGAESLFHKWCWERWTVTCKRIKLDYSLVTYKKTSSKWSKSLSVEPETIQFLEENLVHFLILVLVIFFFLGGGRICILIQEKQSKK